MTSTRPETVQPTVEDIAKAAELGPEAVKVRGSGTEVRPFIAALLEAKLFPDAVRFIAHALPRREAVWWALLCAKDAAGDDPPPAVRASLDATDRWIRHPNDELRREAMAAAQKATLETPAGCAGVAAFLSGGSLSVPGQPEVPSGPFMTAKAVAGAVIIASLVNDPKTAPDRFRRYVEQGMHIGEQAGAWRTGGGR
jgi:hypothetical protein